MAKSNKKTTKSEREARATEATEVRTRRTDEQPSDDRSLLNRIVIVALVLLGLWLLFGLFTNTNDRSEDDAADDKDKTSQVENTDESDNKEDKGSGDSNESSQISNGTIINETDTAYNFVAGEGESYTTIARQAIARTAANLTPAERVAAETKLATDANAEWLNIGQELSLDKAAVKAAVDYAKGLSAEEKAAWQPYADLVAWDITSK